jgi:hypothetical protein
MEATIEGINETHPILIETALWLTGYYNNFFSDS